MFRGLSTGAKVRVGIVGAALIGVFAYALAQGNRAPDIDDDAFARLHDDEGDDDDLFGAPGRRAEARRAREAAEAEFEAEEHLRARVESQRTEVERHAARDGLLGERAQPGRALGDIAWSGPIPSIAEDSRPSTVLDPLGVSLTADMATGELHAEMSNPVTRDEIEVAWGSPDRGGDTWVDLDHHACATLAGTAMIWRRCQTLDELIGHGAPRQFGFEPGPIVGQRIDDLRAALADSDLTEFDDRVRWHVASLIDGRAPIELTAQFDRRGTVTRLEVVIPTRVPEALHALLISQMNGHATWTGKGRTVALQPPSEDSVMLTVSR